MAAPQDLAVIGRVAPASDVIQADVALFKLAPGESDRDGAEGGQRVLSDSETYLAYTLKNGRALRFLDRSNNRRGVLKAHANAIHAVHFVNYRSNVGASAAEGEFFVWVVTDESAKQTSSSSSRQDAAEGGSAALDAANARLTVNIYFRLEDRVTVRNFTFFINPAIGVPDVFILYDRTAAVLQCSSRIQHYRGTTVATLAKDSREVRTLNQPVSAHTLCCRQVGEWFVFTTEPTLVVACTLRHRSTPAWAACAGAVIESMQLLDETSSSSSSSTVAAAADEDDLPAVLLAASATTIYQWSLSGSAEPVRVRSFTFGGYAIRTVLNSRNTFAVFNDAQQVALMVYEGQTNSFQTTVFDLETNVTPPGVRFNRAPNYCIVLVSNPKSIRMYQLMLDAKSVAAKPTMSTTQSAQSLSPTPSPAQPRHNSSPSRESVGNHNKQAADEANHDNNDDNTNSHVSLERSKVPCQACSAPSSQVVLDPAIISARGPAAVLESPNSGSPKRSTGLTSNNSSSLLAAVAAAVGEGASGNGMSKGLSPHAISLSPTKSVTSSANATNTNPGNKSSNSTSVLSGLIQQLEKGNLRAAVASPSSLPNSAAGVVHANPRASFASDRSTPSSLAAIRSHPMSTPTSAENDENKKGAARHDDVSVTQNSPTRVPASTFPTSQSSPSVSDSRSDTNTTTANNNNIVHRTNTTSSSDAIAQILHPKSSAGSARASGVTTTASSSSTTIKSNVSASHNNIKNNRASATASTPSSFTTGEAITTASPAAAPALSSSSSALSSSQQQQQQQHSSSASTAARVALHNGALPQTVDGLLSSAASQSDECIRKEVEDLQTVIKNVMQIAELTPHQVLRDHEQLIHLALEAQMTELQNSFAVLEKKDSAAAAAAVTEKDTAAAAGGDGRGAVSLADEEAYNTFAIVKLIAPISKEIAAGVTRGLHETLRAELDNALRNALGSSVRESQKALIKRRLDEALNQSSAFFAREVATRLQDFVSHEMTNTLDKYGVLLQQSQEENRQLRVALQRVTSAEDVMREVNGLRAEVQSLRQSLSSGDFAYMGAARGGAGGAALGANPSSFQPNTASPETMLSTAVHLIEQGKVSQGLEYIVSVDQPSLTMQLLKRVGADVCSQMVSDATVRNDVWAGVLMQLCRKDVIDKGSEDILPMTELMLDVLAERDDMTTATTAMAQQLMSDLRHFIWRQRLFEPDSATMHALRSLEKSLL